MMNKLAKFIKTVFLFPFIFLGELEISIMAKLDDVIAVVSAKLDDLKVKVDAILAADAGDAAAVATAQAAQKAAEDARDQADAEKAAAEAQVTNLQAQLADAQANAVTDAQLAGVAALGEKVDAVLPAVSVDPQV